MKSKDLTRRLASSHGPTRSVCPVCVTLFDGGHGDGAGLDTIYWGPFVGHLHVRFSRVLFFLPSCFGSRGALAGASYDLGNGGY